jgi:hypothetical protein
MDSSSFLGTLCIKNVWFIIMYDVQQKLSNFHGILDIAFYYLVSYIICIFLNFILFPHNGKTVFMNTERYACLKITQKMYGCYLKNQSWLP